MLTLLEFGTAPLIGLLFGILGTDVLVKRLPTDVDKEARLGARLIVVLAVAVIVLVTSLVWPFLHEQVSLIRGVIWAFASTAYGFISCLAASILGRKLTGR